MMHEWLGAGHWYGMGFGWLLLLAPLILVVLLVVQQMSVRGSRPPEMAAKTARDILDERLARGEIDQNEYESRRKSLDT